MKKVAIVGVEGSGKTVMLAGLGDLYTYPDEDGYFLAPKNFGTAAYVAEKIERMRKGEWPMATAGDEMQGLDWTLKRRKAGVNGRPDTICEVSFLDFAGEVYRAAYGISSGDDASLKEQVEELKQYVRGADDLIVLINLRDVITNGLQDKRVQEAMWITKSILDTALGDAAGKDAPRAAIVLSQADSYASTIESCGGARGVLRQHLPHVANDYDWLDIFAVNAVDKTVLDNDGNVVPAADFTTQGLLPILKWIRGGTALPSSDLTGGSRLPQPKTEGSRSSATVIGVDTGTTAEREHKKVQLSGGHRAIAQPVYTDDSFKGRVGREGFWRAAGGYLLLLAIANPLYVVPIVSTLHGKPLTSYPGGGISVVAGVLLLIYSLVRLMPITTRRLHDVNLTGRCLLVLWFTAFVPYLGLLVELMFFLSVGCMNGVAGGNAYGPSPKKNEGHKDHLLSKRKA